MQRKEEEYCAFDYIWKFLHPVGQCMCRGYERNNHGNSHYIALNSLTTSTLLCVQLPCNIQQRYFRVMIGIIC